MAASKTSKSQEAYYSRYKATKLWETNRKRRLERTIKEQPNNENAKAALKGMVYRRKTPKTRVWSASWIRFAKLFKEFNGRFDKDIMSANQDIARQALMKPGPRALEKPVTSTHMPDKSFFSIRTRLGQGSI